MELNGKKIMESQSLPSNCRLHFFWNFVSKISNWNFPITTIFFLGKPFLLQKPSVHRTITLGVVSVFMFIGNDWLFLSAAFCFHFPELKGQFEWNVLADAWESEKNREITPRGKEIKRFVRSLYLSLSFSPSLSSWKSCVSWSDQFALTIPILMLIWCECFSNVWNFLALCGFFLFLYSSNNEHSFDVATVHSKAITLDISLPQSTKGEPLWNALNTIRQVYTRMHPLKHNSAKRPLETSVELLNY